MRNILLGLVVIAVVGTIGYMYLTRNAEAPNSDASDPQTATYSNSDLELAFDYPSGPEGYVLEERTPADEQNLVRTIILMRTEDRERMNANPPVGGEGPPVISIQVFNNAKKQFPLAWAQENTQRSNLNLKTSANESEIVVGGANAIGYMADGLYPSENIVVASGSHIYVITGQYLENNSDIRRDFQPIVNSIRFIPPASSSKIDINVVCEGALAHMTFPNGEAAEKFVADCKAGKHPEVIEQYKKDMGLGDGAAI